MPNPHAGSSSSRVPLSTQNTKGVARMWYVVMLCHVWASVSCSLLGGFPIQWGPNVLSGVWVGLVVGLPTQTRPIPLWVACAATTIVGSLVVWLFRMKCGFYGGHAQLAFCGTSNPGCGSVWLVCDTVVCGIVLVICVDVVCGSVLSR